VDLLIERCLARFIDPDALSGNDLADISAGDILLFQGMDSRCP
jgi:hypothetical protein